MSILTATVKNEAEIVLPLSDALYEEVDVRPVELPPAESYAQILTTRPVCLLLGLM